jgi:hypothetical protein
MSQDPGRLRRPPSERFAGPEHVFNLAAVASTLRHEDHPGTAGHRQLTLFHAGDLALVLFDFEAGGVLAGHEAQHHQHAGHEQHAVGRVGDGAIESADTLDGPHEAVTVPPGQPEPERIGHVRSDGHDGRQDVDELEQEDEAHPADARRRLAHRGPERSNVRILGADAPHAGARVDLNAE